MNSITYGAYLANRTKNAYPAQLQQMLGKNYHVTDFGHGGATLLKNTDNSYWKTKAYADALASNPNIVIIKLGTNDSKSANRNRLDEFIPTYKELIASFKKIQSKPRIILCTPVTCFSMDSVNIYKPFIKERIIPTIKQIAYEEKGRNIGSFPFVFGKSRSFVR